MTIFDPILKGIGTFLAWIDGWAGNYLLVLLIFTVLIELLFLPFGIKQQKNSIKQAKLRPKEMAIRKKYAGRNDKATQQKIAVEIQDLYKQENYSQLAGCLPMLIQLPIILIIYNVVIDPLKYVVQLNADTIEALKTLFGAGTDNSSIKLLTDLKSQIAANPDFLYQSNLDAAAIADLEPHMNSLPDFNVLGINMGGTPSLAWNWLLLVPVLTFVVYFLSMKLSRKLTYQPTINDQQAGCSNKIMDIVMPLFSLFIAFRVPAAVGIYWIYKSIIGTLKQFILMKAMPLPVCTEEDIKAAEKELKGKAPLPERELPEEHERTIHDEEDDDDEPYPTFVGVKGGRYDDDSSEERADEKPQEKQKNGNISDKLDTAPVKEDDRDEKKPEEKKSEENDNDNNNNN